MGPIQGAVNSVIQSASYLSKLSGIENNVQGIKESTKDIPGQIESLKTSRQQEKDYNTYISNPNILKWRKTEQEYYKNQLKWASAANSAKQKLAEIKARHSLTDKADNMAKQKSDFKDLQLSIGGQKIDYNMLGENVKKQIDKEINDDK